jgi:hypothetical protein
METFAKLFGSLLIFVCHCFDRIVINGYLRGLSRPEQVAASVELRGAAQRPPTRSTKRRVKALLYRPYDLFSAECHHRLNGGRAGGRNPGRQEGGGAQ